MGDDDEKESEKHCLNRNAQFSPKPRMYSEILPLDLDSKLIELANLIEKETGTANIELESLSKALSHVQKSRGKLIRPRLLFYLAEAFEAHHERNVTYIAAIVELIHVASLCHDDVIDNSDVRRKMPSLKAELSNKVAILTGDFLLTRAVALLAKTKNTELVSTIVRAVENLCLGELVNLQFVSVDHLEKVWEKYELKNYYKTASLFAQAFKCVAIIAKESIEVQNLCHNLGAEIGNLFQLRDDVLDFESEEKTGKAQYQDLKERDITAPILYAVEVDKTILQDLLHPNTDIYAIAKRIENAGGLEKAKQRLKNKHQKILNMLEELNKVTQFELTSLKAILSKLNL